MAPIGLYYPYTHFHDRGWLKVAALYWPRMARIAPLGYADAGNRDARVLRDELDFVLDLGPGVGVLERTQRAALAALDRDGSQIRNRYRIPRSVVRIVGGASSAGAEHVEYYFPDLDESVSMEHPARRWPKPLARPDEASFGRLIGLHRTKVGPELLRSLEEHRLAVLDDRGDYAAVHPNFAWAYMCMLADHMAAEERLTPVSDDASAYGAVGNWNAEHFANALLGRDTAEPAGDEHLIERLAMLALQIAVPADPATVRVDRIVEIRKRYGSELDAFRDLIAATATSLSTEIQGVKDATVVESYLEQEIARRVERPLTELRRAMRGLGVDTALGTAAIKFEFPAAAALAAGWATGQPVVAAAGAALGVGSWYRSWKTAGDGLVRASPVGYLWRVEKDLQGGEILRRILRPTPLSRDA
ncbi:hypothetical protein GCM10028833_24810 [Glycomyces tarimensis]